MANLARKLSGGNTSSQNSTTSDKQQPQLTVTNISDTSDIKEQKSPKKPRLTRRHSITICESRTRTSRKVSTMSVSKGTSNYDEQNYNTNPSGPFSMMPVSNEGKQNFIFIS